MTHQNKINCLYFSGGQLDEFLSQILLYLSSDLYKRRSMDENAHRLGAKVIEREGLKITVATHYNSVFLQSLCGIRFTGFISMLRNQTICVVFFVREHDLLGSYILPQSMNQDNVIPDEIVKTLINV